MKLRRPLYLLVAVLLSAVPVSVSAEVVTLTPVADTALFESVPDNNLGASQSLAAGNTAGASPTRSVMKFDVSAAVPAGAKITGARLDLTVVRSPFLVEPAIFEAHRLLADWGEGDKGAGAVTGIGGLAAEGEATWNARMFGVSTWTTPGGDFATEISASAAVSGDTISFSGANLVTDVQGWMENPSSNFGWLIKDQFETTATTARRIGSREHPTSAPKLVIEFESPLRILSNGLKDGKFCLTFMAQSRGYIVEARAAVDSGEWQTVGTVPAADGPIEVEICDPAPVGGPKFYRVREM